MNDYINLKKRESVLKIGIKDEKGNTKKDENGNEIYIEFDLEDIGTPDRYNKSVQMVKKATNDLKNEILIINKKQDSKGKGIMSKNEEAKMEALRKFYKSGEEAMDMFLGKDGIKKIFGETRYLTMFDDLSEMLEPILPKLKFSIEKMEKKIKEKYKTTNDNVLKAD